ncbi:MAG: penicillin-binding protein 1C [Proteobacteria bacterium]|nr:MAG: penicillin-binding protein 1C [Pseudomonadota bacterium]
MSLFVIFLILDFLYPLDRDKLYRLQSQKVLTKKGEVLRMGLSRDGFWRFDVKSDELPELLKKSVILFEDRYFYYHFGVNPYSILRAFFHNLTGKKTIGASTLSMQIARMMKRKKRSYKNKIIEIFNAFQLEWHFSKDEILLFYLNLAPYGGNIEGIGAASYFYFKSKPKDLTIAQIALLTTIPKNPNLNRLDSQKNLHAKRRKVLSLMYKNHLISKSQNLRSRIEPIIKKRFKAPFYAPQYTNIALKNKAKIVNLDLQIQLFLEKTLKKASNALKKFDVKNAAAVLIDNENMNVIAYVGSKDFKSPLGQNDGVRAVRSPGSTLKPFIYALALENGLITPKQNVFDLPLYAGFYEPENFDKKFMGLVRAEEALQYSLNIPAVELNMFLENKSLYEMLKTAQISSLDKSKEFYGHSLALGGFGISLLELTHLYTAFSNKGRILPLRVGGKLVDKNISIMSKESAYLVSEILSQGIRSRFSEFWESMENMPKIGFKTGTSADSKDLYTIGFSKKYTLGVWMGNFDGSKTKDLTGLDTASEVVFELFSYLNSKKQLQWLEKPKNIQKSLVCLDAIKKNTCKNKDYDFTIKGVGRKYPCKRLRGQVLAFLMKEKMITSINDFSRHICYPRWIEKKPALISPYDGAEIFMDKERKIMLKCFSFSDDDTIYFSIDDGDLIESKSSQEVFVKMQKGSHKVSCLDANSKKSTNHIIIKGDL